MKLVAALLLLAALPLTACSSTMAVREPAPAATIASARTPRQAAYVVGGRVKGLEGIGLALSNSGQEIQVEDDGRFAFRSTLANGTEFNITIERQPISPAQTCVVEHASGTIAGKNALETTIVCSTVSFDTAPVSTAVTAN